MYIKERSTSGEFPSDESRNWFDRTFGRMKEGSIRGNMFLLIVTTVGSAFFVLPHCARQIGFFFTMLLVLASASLSVLCSEILYQGFKETSANTYNECMERLLGRRMGLASAFVIMLHTFGSSISTWIFSWMYFSNGFAQVLGYNPNDPNHQIPIAFQHAFFYTGMLIIFMVTLFRSIEKLKLVSMIGFVMIILLTFVLISLTPHYFTHFSEQGYIKFVSFKWELYALKVWGITNYLFLNQYAITPICKTTKNLNFRRVTKIIGRTIFIVCIVYVIILFCGYFSLPTNSFQEIFLLRPPIAGESDIFIKWGKLIFGCALFIGVTVRSHFVLIYLDQLITKYREVTADPVNSSQSVEVRYASNDGETATMYPKSSVIVWKPAATVRNFIFLATISTCATFGVNYLVKIVGFMGSFVGVFELIIIPSAMFLAIDQRYQLMGKYQRISFVFFAAFLAIISFCAVVTNFIM